MINTNTTINNIHNLKYYNEVKELLDIKDIKVFANEINNIYKLIEQYRKQNDTYVKIIDDYEMERQYLLDKIAEMQGTKNIYIFDKEDEYNTVPEHFINTNQNIDIEENKTTSKQDILNTVITVVKNDYETETNIINISDLMQKKQKQQQQQEQQEETYIFTNNGMYDYNIKNDEEFIKRMNDKSPLNKYNTFKDYINKFSIYDKDDKKAVKKAIVEDFKKAGFKVKVNNGHYYSLDVILEIKKDDIMEKDIYNKAKNELYDNFEWYSVNNMYNLNLNKDLHLTEKENIDILKNYYEEHNRLNEIKYNSFEIERIGKDKGKKSLTNFFLDNEVRDKILRTAKNIICKYSILKSYDAYSDYNSTYRTFDFDFYIKLI